MGLKPFRPITLVRVAVALLLVAHGVARASLGIVDDFGVFLTSIGFPLGAGVAWLLTSIEVIGGLALAIGVAVLPLSLWFAAQLAVGIALVHAPEGWFVVGAGRNGAEYSVLLIACLAALAWDAYTGARPARS